MSTLSEKVRFTQEPTGHSYFLAIAKTLCYTSERKETKPEGKVLMQQKRIPRRTSRGLKITIQTKIN